MFPRIMLFVALFAIASMAAPGPAAVDTASAIACYVNPLDPVPGALCELERRAVCMRQSAQAVDHGRPPVCRA